MSEEKPAGRPTDKTMPDGKWAFDQSVTDVFDDMLQRSIPQYQVMRDAVTALASRYAKRGTAIVDLGCSKGEAIAPLVDRFGVNNTFHGVEVSKPMLAEFAARFKGMIASGIVRAHDQDIRAWFPPCRASVTLAVLTLQFTPINYRQGIIQRVYDHTEPGGAFIVVEKVLGEGAEMDAMMVEHYHSLKASNGYSREAIDRKALALEGVLVPVTAQWNADLLRRAGFREVDCFWRWMNFAGWVAVKS